MEKIIKLQHVHISKCLTSVEGPPKTKHIRGIILGTHDLNGADVFFHMANQMSLQSNPYISYKFLYALHKILREGHENCIKDSLKNAETIVKLGKMWSHLRDQYSICITSFAKLIIQKLKFHRKYPTVPGSLSLTGEQMAEMAGNNVNTLFELSIDLLDYMDEILNFQATVFDSFDRSRSNSMTHAGQCRLIPLVQCVQDAASLYDAMVKLLFRLHNMLPGDTLSGHRERFVKQYTNLQRFFEQARHLQYFRNLINVPALPANPPNFLIQSELAAHRAPVVTAIPVSDELDDDGQEEESITPAVSNLLDLSDSAPTTPNRTSSSWTETFSPDFSQLGFNGSAAYEKNRDLRLENDALKAEIEKLKNSYKEQMDFLRARIQSLENEVKTLVQLKGRLEDELASLRNAKNSRDRENLAYQEKFTRLRDAYTKLRNEHVDLLRKTATVQTQIQEEKQKCQAKEEELKMKAAELAHLEHERVAWAEMQQGEADSQSRLHEAKTKLMDLQRRQQELEEECITWRQAKDESEAQIKEMSVRIAHLEQLRLEKDEKVQELQSKLREGEEEGRSAQEAEERLTRQLSELQRSFEELRTKSERYHHLQPDSLLRSQCEAGCAHLKRVLDMFSDAEMVNSRGSAELLLTMIEEVVNIRKDTQQCIQQYLMDDSCVDHVLTLLAGLIARVGDTLLHLKAVSNGAQSMEQTDHLIQLAKRLVEVHCQWLQNLPLSGKDEEITNLWNEVRTYVSNSDMLCRSTDVNAHDVGVLVDEELRSTTEAIELAQNRFQELLNQSRSQMNGLQLEVNESILDSCTNLMHTIQTLIEKSKVLQREIVAEGRGTTSTNEFYKKNHRWTEGLISAAKSIGLGANILVKEADKFVSGRGSVRPEQLEICSREISASTVQLVVTSRVKANPQSISLRQLMETSSEVTNATGRVVASAKSAAELFDREEVLDFSKFSLTQAKMAEMESQVRVLQLESQLTQERKRLGELRKHHYKLASEAEQANAEK